MVCVPLTNRALRIVYDAHAGQRDRCGTPYVFRPYHVAEQMPDEATVCAALLHDVVEDAGVALEDFAREFPPAVVEAVRLLTREPGAPYPLFVLGPAERFCR